MVDEAEFERFKASVLGDATDDLLGIYEVWWEANRRYPSLPLSERLAIAERVVSELVGAEKLRLYWRGSNSGTNRPVPEDQIEIALRDWATWVPQPEPAEMVWLGT